MSIRPENPYQKELSNVCHPEYAYQSERHRLKRDAFEEGVTATLLSVAAEAKRQADNSLDITTPRVLTEFAATLEAEAKGVKDG